MILVEVLSILELEVVVSNLLIEEEIQSSKMEIFFFYSDSNSNKK